MLPWVDPSHPSANLHPLQVGEGDLDRFGDAEEGEEGEEEEEGGQGGAAGVQQ